MNIKTKAFDGSEHELNISCFTDCKETPDGFKFFESVSYSVSDSAGLEYGRGKTIEEAIFDWNQDFYYTKNNYK